MMIFCLSMESYRRVKRNRSNLHLIITGYNKLIVSKSNENEQ
jgi:hypothetical protein